MSLATTIANNARIQLNLASALVENIPADRFARKPQGIDANSPAFLLTHLLIYPDKAILPMVGKPELAKDFAAYDALAAPGEPCQDDPQGSIYATKDELLAAYIDRYTQAADALQTISDDVLDAQTPAERYRERFPTVGDLVSFLMGSHVMFHLGQISTWRRCEGLGSAM